MASFLIQGGTIVTMNRRRQVFSGDLRISGSRITALAPRLKQQSGDTVVDASDCFVIPGLIQVHTHLCQALFRGRADDMALLDWLKLRIWPLEHAHDETSLALSARIALTEMQLLGTTTILDMGTVAHTDILFAEAEKSGMRYWGGKCLMDVKGSSGPLYEARAHALNETEALIQRWHQKSELLNYAICPRFAVSCSEDLLRACADLQKRYQVLIHTHASESREEVAMIKRRTGRTNVDYLNHIGLLNSRTVIVHGIHLTKKEIQQLKQSHAKLVHCPSANLKLASGVAPIHHYLQQGLTVGLGSDGAACNNTMDPFLEMRLAALLQKPLFGPEALPAPVAFELATLGGARVLDQEKNIGSLESGKYADVVIVDRSHPSVITVDDPYSALVYSCSGRDVRDVWIHGRPVVRSFRHCAASH